MEIRPIEYTPEHQLWVEESISQLQSVLDAIARIENSERSGLGTLNGPPSQSTSDRQAWDRNNPSLSSKSLHDPRAAESDLLDARARGNREYVGYLGWHEPDEWLPTLLLADRLLELHRQGVFVFSEPPEVTENTKLASDRPSQPQTGSGIRAGVLQEALGTLGGWLMQLVRTSPAIWDDEGAKLVQLLASQKASECYLAFRKVQPKRCLGQFLQTMFASGHPNAIRLAVDLLVEQPPEEWKEISQAIGTLMQSSHWKIADVFPRLLETTQPAVLSPAIDLANMLVRKFGVVPHPAASKFEQFLSLYGTVTQQLTAMEENPRRYSDSVQTIQRILFDSVSLLVSLSDFFALFGDQRAIGKLNQAIELKHRRIKLEAAFALAKLGEKRAIDLVVELLSDDSSRMRAIAYLQELSAEDRIAPEWTTSLAKAKSDLALWLSQPEQFALPPTKIELQEQRTMDWPGFDGPQECFLLQYDYGMGENVYSNIGFSGPFACALALDMKAFNNDTLFAMYLANDVEDPSESKVAWDSLSEYERRALGGLVDDLEEKGFREVRALAKLTCLGHSAVLCQGLSRGTTDEGNGWGILTDGESVIRCPAGPNTFETLFLQWKGSLAMGMLGED